MRGRRFAVRARRTTGQPGLPFDSPDLERAVGAALLAASGGVDLDHPEVTAGIEVHTEQVYLCTEKLARTGGMPLGIEGRALALVSGGFDSAVAAWEIWKRGVGLRLEERRQPRQARPTEGTRAHVPAGDAAQGAGAGRRRLAPAARARAAVDVAGNPAKLPDSVATPPRTLSTNQSPTMS